MSYHMIDETLKGWEYSIRFGKDGTKKMFVSSKM